ncbi:signal recognition particle-docking protein FtsY [Candidatus Woesearchaeota archaeon]|nr:signal recognition particle-docking protein FtsY [Candidatus Woesearchaeota archaeon]
MEEKSKEEQKGFFARLKEKFTAKEEREEEKESAAKPFETSEDELKEFEEAFKEKKEQEEKAAKEEPEEEIIPVVTETEEGETIFEIQEKPGTNHEETKRETVEEEKEESGFFSALKNTIFKTSLSEEKFEELFWELEMVLLENNVAVEVIELMKQNLKKDLVEKKILRGEINDIILRSLQKSVEQTFDVPGIDFIERVKEKKPFVIVFVGINGSGKTTTIAKMAHKLKENNLSCVIAAGDTFRAAAIQQLEEHANRLHIKMIKHDYGSDPAAVGFDAIKYAQAHNVDCVLIDTAGRLHSNVNLMDEMKKIIRVTKPDLKIFIGEAITGNDCVDQARKFHEAIGIDGIVLAKADVDEKGGAALSISYVTKKPIIYIGTGQGYNDLQPFDKEKVMEQIGLA